MGRHHVVRRLPYGPDPMCALVGDVARYPDFIPWITAMRTGEVRDEGGGADALDAEASVRFAFVREVFATHVRRDPAGRRVDVRLLSGPFRKLEAVWSFSPHRIGCEVDFLIDFEFKGRVLDALLRANFAFAVDRLINCFEARARALYGPSATRPSASGAAPAPS